MWESGNTGQSFLYLIIIFRRNVMKTAKTILHLLIILVFLAFLTSCKKSDSPSVPVDNSPIITDIGTPNGILSGITIGPSGGTLESADGNLTVTIPPGALSSETEISIQPVTNTAPLGLGSGYRLQPEGITFANPIQLTFHYNEQLLKESLEDFLWIVTQAGDGSWKAMLKSAVDKNAKTVTIATTHFSDWVLGRFIGFTLTPSLSAIQKGKSVQLRLTGFARDKSLLPGQESVTLSSLLGDGAEGLTLEGYDDSPAWESRIFKVRQWSINGVVAPVSNSNGSLQISGNSSMNVTYTAPNKMPAKNPIKISVSLEAVSTAGNSREFLVSSDITVVDDDFYLLVKIDGQELEYYNNDSTNNTRIYCFVGDDHFQIIADMEGASDPTKNIFTLAFRNPSVTTRILNGPTGQSENLSFFTKPELEYTLNYEERTSKDDGTCVHQDEYGNATATLTEFAGIGSIARGSFSGTLWEDNTQLKEQCKMPIAHSIEGIFSLVVQP
jgi:hypothetical protein